MNAQSYDDIALPKLITMFFRLEVDQTGELLLIRCQHEAIKVSSFVRSQIDIRSFE